MKKISFQVMIIFFSTYSYATQWTVSNDPNRPAQFTDLQNAIDNALDGDTLIIYASSAQYGSPSINKKLTLIGEGHNDCYSAKSTMIGDFTLGTNAIPVTSASGSVFISLQFNRMNTGGVSNVVIERCRIVATSSSNGINAITQDLNGWKVINCSFKVTSTIGGSVGINLGSGSNNIISNNLFFLIPNSYTAAGVTYSSSSTNILSQNIFIVLGSPNSLIQPFDNFTNGTLVNNIIYGLNIESCADCSYSGNMSIFTFSNGNIPASGNYLDIDPEFVGTNITSSTCADFNLEAGSPANGAGGSGEDLGVYGGTFAFEDVQNGRPPSPAITSFAINNPVLNDSEDLSIDVSAEKGKN